MLRLPSRTDAEVVREEGVPVTGAEDGEKEAGTDRGV